jgi:hypothetical protein
LITPLQNFVFFSDSIFSESIFNLSGQVFSTVFFPKSLFHTVLAAFHIAFHEAATHAHIPFAQDFATFQRSFGVFVIQNS